MQLHNELRVPLKWRKHIASVSLLQRFVEMKIYQYACDMMWSGRSNCVDLLVRDEIYVLFLFVIFTEFV